MSDPKIVASAREAGRRAPVGDRSDSWKALGWIGLVFLLVGGADYLLLWFPLSFGNREWEYATVTQSLNGLPILLLGLGLLMVAGEEVGRRWWTTLALIATAGLLVWVLVGFAFWSGNVGLAMATVPEELRIGIQRAAVKTVIQSLAYSAILAFLIWSAWTRARRSRVGS